MADQEITFPPAEGESPDTLSVSAAMALAKSSLEGVVVSIIGEVSEVSVKPGYKAAYFTVKDTSASLPCMMWNNRYRDAGFDLAVGQLIEMTGRFTLYAAKGRMNFDAFSIALAGEGDLRMKVAAIARKLRSEGLTDSSRKRPIPIFPQRIGLVTSPRSAAVHDVLRTLRRRFPVAEVLLAGVAVEGAQAPAGIIEGLNRVSEAGAEMILVVRGGGSFEDLMPFNDEALARAIAACPVPVITGIGHEVDTSIADMVADLRASTPTAAAEAASPSPESLSAQLTAEAASLKGALGRRLERTRDHLAAIAAKPLFRDSMLLFAAEAQWLDVTAERLQRALPQRLERLRDLLGTTEGRLSRVGAGLLERFRTSLAQKAARLEDLSPLGVLGRGYSITRTSEGVLVDTLGKVSVGEALTITVSDGRICATVDSTERSAS